MYHWCTSLPNQTLCIIDAHHCLTKHWYIKTNYQVNPLNFYFTHTTLTQILRLNRRHDISWNGEPSISPSISQFAYFNHDSKALIWKKKKKTWDLRISRSLFTASDDTSSFVKNDGFAATTCIASSDPTRRTASSGAFWSSTSNDKMLAIRPRPAPRIRAISYTFN